MNFAANLPPPPRSFPPSARGRSHPPGPPGPSRPCPSFPRPPATVGARDRGAITFFLRHGLRGGRVAPPAAQRPGVSCPPRCGTPPLPQARSWPPRPHFLTRPSPVSPPTASPWAAGEPECREQRAAGALRWGARACAGRRATRRRWRRPRRKSPTGSPGEREARGSRGRPASRRSLQERWEPDSALRDFCDSTQGVGEYHHLHLPPPAPTPAPFYREETEVRRGVSHNANLPFRTGIQGSELLAVPAVTG